MSLQGNVRVTVYGEVDMAHDASAYYNGPMSLHESRLVTTSTAPVKRQPEQMQVSTLTLVHQSLL